MFSSLLVALALNATEVRPLLDPISYCAVAITTSDGEEAASLLAVTDSALDPDALSREQKAAWDDLVARIGSQYPGADRRQRARLSLEVLILQGKSRYRSDHSVWLKFPDGSAVHAERVSYPESGTIWRIVDLSSGQYMAIVRAGDTSELTPMFQELFRESTRDAAAKRIRETAAKLEEKIEGMVEVNGRREYLGKGMASPGSVITELVALLPNLYGDGKDRILQALAILTALRGDGVKEVSTEIRVAASLCSPQDEARLMPLPTVPKTLQIRAIARRAGAFLEPPEPEVVKPFFGSKGWPQPDLCRGFKQQVTKLLSGS